MNDLEHGRACYERRAWREAFDALQRADEATPLQADDVERLATAACLSGREAAFLRLLERQYRSCDQSGDQMRAARCAFWLALTFLSRGEVGQSNAWTARGQRLIEGHDCVERGYLALPVAEQQLHEGHADAAAATARQAIAIAQAFGDADLMAAAASSGTLHSAVDISHRNVAVIVSGPGADVAINSGCPQDLSLAIFPVLILYVIFSRQLIRGITAGAVK